jgi:hypothetical protein
LKVGEGSRETFSTSGTVETIPILHKTREQMISNSTFSIMKTQTLLRKSQRNQRNGRGEDNSAFKLS